MHTEDPGTLMAGSHSLTVPVPSACAKAPELADAFLGPVDVRQNAVPAEYPPEPLDRSGAVVAQLAAATGE